MQRINKVFLFFEQSGTFKKQFIDLGIPAEDYDILNDYGQTDHITDLFKEIENAYDHKPSVFDEVGGDDLVMAFFPCVRFSIQFILALRQEANQCQNLSWEDKMDNTIKYHDEVNYMYKLISKMAKVCLEKKIKIVIENPYNTQHYLTRYWPIKPTIIDTNRREMGDYYEKPTQYFFINHEPENNLLFDEPIAFHKKRIVIEERGARRSELSPDYARRFIRTYLIAKEDEDG